TGGNAATVNAATTLDGNEFWVAGNSGTGSGLEYVASLGSHSSTQLSTASFSQIRVFSSGPGSASQFNGPQLYGSLSGSFYTITGPSPYLGGSSPGALPTAGTATVTTQFAPGLPIRAIVDLDTNQDGVLDTVYYADGNSGGIHKWYWNGSAWANLG